VRITHAARNAITQHVRAPSFSVVDTRY